MLTGSSGCRVPRRLQPRSSRSSCRQDPCVSYTKDTHKRPGRHTVTHTPKASSHHHTYAIQAQRNNAYSQVCKIAESREGSSLEARDQVVTKIPARHTQQTHTRRGKNSITHTPKHHHFTTHIRKYRHSATRIITVHAGCRVPRRLQLHARDPIPGKTQQTHAQKHIADTQCKKSTRRIITGHAGGRVHDTAQACPLREGGGGAFNGPGRGNNGATGELRALTAKSRGKGPSC